MIVNTVKDLVDVVLVKATGAPKVSGTVYVVARLELDGDASDGMYWCSTHSAWEASPHAFPTATYELGGAWAYQRPAVMTTGKVSATKPARIWSRMTDNASSPESETACSSPMEEMIYSTGAAEAATGAAESVVDPVTVATNNDKSGYSLTTAPLDAAETRSALGLATANLDTQLGTIASSASSAASSSSSAASSSSSAASSASTAATQATAAAASASTAATQATTAATQATNAAADALLARKLAECDYETEITAGHTYVNVYVKGTATLLYRKECKDITGAAISSAATPVASATETA